MYAIFKHTDKIQFIGHAENLEQFHNLVSEREHLFPQDDGRILDQGKRWLNECEFTLDFGNYQYTMVEPQDLTSDELYAGIKDPSWDFERPKVEYTVQRFDKKLHIFFNLKKETLSKFIDIEPEALPINEDGDMAYIVSLNNELFGDRELCDNKEQETEIELFGTSIELQTILQHFERQGYEIPRAQDIMNLIQSDISDAISTAWEIEEA